MSAPLIPLRKVRTLSEIVEAVIDTLRQHIKPLAMGVIRYAGPWLVVAIALVALSITRMWVISADGLFTNVKDVAIQLLSQIPIYIAFAASQMMVTAYLLLAEQLGRTPSADELHEAVKGRMGLALITDLLTALVLIGATILLVIPAIYLMVPMSLVYVIRHVEGLNFSDAIGRARTLVRDQWWWTLGVLFVMGLIQTMIGWIGAMPATVMSMITLFSDLEGGGGTPSTFTMILLIVAQTISTIVSAFASLIGLSTVVYLYFSHRERIEGASLLERIRSIAPDADAA